jgi:aminopeptidase N
MNLTYYLKKNLSAFAPLWLIFLLSFITSCSLIGININRKAPKHASKYPKFKEQDSLVGYLSKNRDCYQPYYYELAVDFNIREKSIQGSNKIFILAKEDFNTILLNLNEQMKIYSIKYNGQLLSYRRKYTGLWINFPNTIQKGEHIVIDISYGGIPVIAKRPPWEGGFVWKKDAEKRPWIGVACEQVGANLWWPLKDHLTAEPDSMQMSYTVPKGLICVSNGKLLDQTDSADKTTFTYKVSYPINTYNVTFYIGKFEHFSISYNKEEKKRLHFYVLDYNLEKAQNHFKQTKKVVQTFEKLYGEYAYWQDDFKLVESPYEGMEHQTAIAYGNGYRNNAYGVDYIILHETAHEWWGNAISVKDYADIWIHEGMATYSEALYLEETLGRETYNNYLYFYSILIKNKKPVVGPTNVNYWNYKDSDPYMKGALMMHSLRISIGNDSTFFDILKSFYQQYKHQTVTSQNFIDMVNLKTGSNYSWFFNQYLYKHQPPKLEYFIEVSDKSNEQTFYYKWTNVADDFMMPILVKNADGSKTKIYPTTTEKSIQFSGERLIEIDVSSAYFAKTERKRK